MLETHSPKKRLICLSFTFFSTIALFSPMCEAVPTPEELERAIGYRFKNPKYIESVFKHPSRHQDNRDSFERLEWAGDALLTNIVSERLFHDYPTEDPGALSEKRAQLVSNTNNESILDRLGIFGYIEYQDGHNNLSKIKADTCEALLQAIHLDGKVESVRDFVYKHWFPSSVKSLEISNNNARQRLHQVLNKQYKKQHSFIVTSVGSSYQAKIVIAGTSFPQTFQGKTKNEAKNQAAIGALAFLDANPLPLQKPKVSKTCKESWKAKINCHGFSATFEASTKKGSKRMAAKAAYEKLSGLTVNKKKSCEKLHQFCQAKKYELPSYQYTEI